MRSVAKTVAEYLNELPEDRRSAITQVRKIILDNMPTGYQETINWGMISYEVPLSIYPDTYNKQPLMYLALGSQKNYMTLHAPCAYGSEILRKKLDQDFKRSNKKLDMGKGCIRFKKLDDLSLPAIANLAAALPMERYVEYAKSVRRK